MYRISKFLLIICWYPAASFPQTGYLSVDCPENTAIYLDSVLIARQPFSGLSLFPGRYRISMDPVDDFSWQRRVRTREIEIRAFEYTSIDLGNIGSVTIYSDPIGSDVFSGSRYLGKTPLIFSRPAAGSDTLRIKRAGYQEEKVQLNNGMDLYQVKLSPIDPGRSPTVQEAMLSGVRVNWFKESLVLTSFASSWAAFFFKRKADDLYLQYQRAAVPSRIDYFYNETEKYDRYSEVALGISAATLGVYLFILMTE